ncbi:hypothetical protein Goklo_004629 [Gossypium klotzschianum]|uniref:Uncharacterized protein n=1 Tax=Gossypium klotzschianum TaxID=34286 RepID=A0A7J8VPY8_9ROSI|nr:hypothetical protein [Gossypium klotzschianum]
MVNLKVIVEHFEATIGDHPKIKVREIERREFAKLWDDAGELRLKNLGSTIKMAMNRVTPKSPPHFKRFYVYFKEMKRGWKEGCKLILGLDGCFLKGSFKGELLATIRRDGNN